MASIYIDRHVEAQLATEEYREYRRSLIANAYRRNQMAITTEQLQKIINKQWEASAAMNRYNTAPNPNQERGLTATEKKEPTMNKIAIHQDAQTTIELSTSVYYTPAKEIVVRQALGLGNILEPYKLAEHKGKLTMENAAIVQLPLLTVTDVIPAPKQSLEVQELQAGDAVLLQRGWGFVISVTESKEHPQDVVVRYLTVEGEFHVETIAQETYTTAVLAFDAAIDGSPAFKEFAFDILSKLVVITNGNANRALAIYRVIDKVGILGEAIVKKMLLGNVEEACYRSW